MRHLLTLFFITILTLFSVTFSYANNSWKNKVDPNVLDKAEAGQLVEYIVVMQEQADLSLVKNLSTKQEKGAFVYAQLRATAEKSQVALINLLDQAEVYYQSFFLINAAFVESKLDVLEAVASLEGVKNIHGNPLIQAEIPAQPLLSGASRGGNAVEWGISKIQADKVWDLGIRGEDIVIGGQDTGYEWDHPALKEKYRGWDGMVAEHAYNWHDAIQMPINGDTNPCGYASDSPCDDHFHGTHTMGTMVGDEGDNQIGVAPDAQWIGCRNMDKGVGTPVTYIECFEWFLAPYDLDGQNPNPGLAPHVINNSWSCPESEGCFPNNFEVMQMAVDNLRAAGVVVVVSAGNSGNACSTVNRPAAIYESSFSVGATQQNDTIAGFSSRGPVTVDGSNRLKPDVSAPGVGVRSATLNGNYGLATGTSMAGPHVAGLVALIISANPNLAGNVDEIEEIIRLTAVPRTTDQECGGIPGSEVPNHTYGYGRVDALAAVSMALDMVSDVEKVKENETVRVFPNPFSNRIFLSFDEAISKENVQFELFNASGQLLVSRKLNLLENIESVEVPLLANGYYFYRLKMEGKILSGKLVKR